jgi:hypothetical protein
MPVTKQILQILDRYLESKWVILQNQLLFPLRKLLFHFKILILLNHSQSRLYSIWTYTWHHLFQIYWHVERSRDGVLIIPNHIVPMSTVVILYLSAGRFSLILTLNVLLKFSCSDRFTQIFSLVSNSPFFYCSNSTKLLQKSLLSLVSWLVP